MALRFRQGCGHAAILPHRGPLAHLVIRVDTQRDGRGRVGVTQELRDGLCVVVQAQEYVGRDRVPEVVEAEAPQALALAEVGPRAGQFARLQRRPSARRQDVGLVVPFLAVTSLQAVVQRLVIPQRLHERFGHQQRALDACRLWRRDVQHLLGLLYALALRWHGSPPSTRS